ncbi:MAG: hypothetical protein GEU26_13235 [Nitrososphaeraceae archaeon]|nr:hypothetical protein [Nitrososphaeraceae archaeon]
MTQTGMIAASLALLVYIAVVITGSSLIPRQGEDSSFLSQQDNQTIISQQARIDAALRDQISSGLDYVHNATTDTASLAVLLSGLNLSQNQFILLYDSTPFASKGHIALNLPCDSTDPRSPLFQVLVGRAPDIIPTRLGYIEQVSAPPDMCVYHAQFGFGDPVTDVILKYIANGTINLQGPHSVAITTHESYIPKIPSLQELQHE